MAHAFAQQLEKDNALMLIDRAGQVGMGGVSQYQTMALNAQPSMRASKPLSMGPEIAQRQGLDIGIAKTMKPMMQILRQVPDKMRQAVQHAQRIAQDYRGPRIGL